MSSDLVNFIECQVKILSDPLFGDLQSGQLSSSFRVKPKSKLTSKGLATVSAVNMVSDWCPSEVQNTVPVQQKGDSKMCIACKDSHSLERCSRLKNMTHREKLNILKDNRSCFGCLKTGHVSKDCRNL